jgi:hypothetical protein
MQINITQNDAGSGKDAGGNEATALMLSQNSYYQSLFSSTGTVYAQNSAYNPTDDAADYYGFNVSAGDFIGITMTPPSGGGVNLALYDTPNGYRTGNTSNMGSTQIITYQADNNGTWYIAVLRATPQTAGGQYTFTLHTGNKQMTISAYGSGSSTELAPYPDNMANWNCCLTNDGDASTVSSLGDGSGYTDLYNAGFSWLPSNATNVVVTVHIVIRSTVNQHRASFATVLYANSTGQVWGGSFSELASYSDEHYSFNITQNDAATLQIGVHINDGIAKIGGVYYYYPGYCTQVYAVITWS